VDLLGFFDELVDALLLLLLVVVVERLAVFLYGALDAMGVDEKDFAVFAFGLLHVAVAVNLLGGGGRVVGVVFAHFFELLLMVHDFGHEGADAGEGLRGRLGDRVGGLLSRAK